MDAVKFVEEHRRLCKMYCGCRECPAAREDGLCMLSATIGAAPDEQVKFLEEWSAAHPLRTRQSVFLEHYPNADLYEDGVLKVCPNVVEGSSYENTRNCGRIPCEVCRKNYWMKAVE